MSDHVEVLRHMKETIKAIMPSEVEALDAAIAALSAPQPPAEAQAQGGGEVCGCGKPVDYFDALGRPSCNKHIRCAPPSAPVVCGEAVAEVVEAEGFYGVGGWVEQPADARKVRGLKGIRGLPVGTKLYLAQQPAAVDGAMVDRACDAYVQIADDCMGLERLCRLAAALTAAPSPEQGPHT